MDYKKYEQNFSLFLLVRVQLKNKTLFTLNTQSFIMQFIIYA